MLKESRWFKCDFCYADDLTEGEIHKVKTRGMDLWACDNCQYKCFGCGKRCGANAVVKEDAGDLYCRECWDGIERFDEAFGPAGPVTAKTVGIFGWLLTLLVGFGVGVMFCLPWIFSDKEIANNVMRFFSCVLGG